MPAPHPVLPSGREAGPVRWGGGAGSGGGGEEGELHDSVLHLRRMQRRREKDRSAHSLLTVTLATCDPVLELAE